MTPSLATCAQFFRIGLEAGVCKPDVVRAWALSVIEKMDEPPGEIIEVSWNKPIPQLISDLNSVQGDANFEVAGRWLLYILLHKMSGEALLWQTITAAKQVATSAGRSAESSELYYLFDAVEDELNLAEQGIYGTVTQCHMELKAILGSHSSPPPAAFLN